VIAKLLSIHESSSESFDMRPDSGGGPTMAPKYWPAIRAILLGAILGAPSWIALGALLAPLLMLLVAGLMRLATTQGYMPYSGSFYQDIWILTKVFAMLGILPGIVCSATMGLVVSGTGLPHEPRFWSLVRWCGWAIGFAITGFGRMIGLLRGRFTDDTAGRLYWVTLDIGRLGGLLVSIEFWCGLFFYSGIQQIGAARYTCLTLGAFVFIFLGLFVVWYVRAALRDVTLQKLQDALLPPAEPAGSQNVDDV